MSYLPVLNGSGFVLDTAASTVLAGDNLEVSGATVRAATLLLRITDYTHINGVGLNLTIDVGQSVSVGPADVYGVDDPTGAGAGIVGETFQVVQVGAAGAQLLQFGSTTIAGSNDFTLPTANTIYTFRYDGVSDYALYSTAPRLPVTSITGAAGIDISYANPLIPQVNLANNFPGLAMPADVFSSPISVASGELAFVRVTPSVLNISPPSASINAFPTTGMFGLIAMVAGTVTLTPTSGTIEGVASIGPFVTAIGDKRQYVWDHTVGNWVRWIPPVPTPTVFAIPDYAPAGHIFDGQHGPDAPYVQAAVNAAGAVGGGTIFWPAGCLTNIGTCINMPAKGNYELAVAGEAPSIYTVNDGYPPGQPANGVLVTGNIGGQPAVLGNSNLIASGGGGFVFNCSAAANHSQGEFTIRVRNMMAYDLSGNHDCLLFLTNQCYIVDVVDCAPTGMMIAYLTGNGGGQMYKMNVKGCVGGGAPILWGDGIAPFIGEIEGNVWTGNGDALNVLPNGEFIEQNTYWTWSIHHNVFQSTAVSAGIRSAIYYANISQTTLGSIDHNCFYGTSGGAVYIKDTYAGGIANASGGLTIDYNEFVGWNASGKVGVSASTAAVYIDAGGADQRIIIGPNIYEGNQQGGAANGLYGLVLVADPSTAGVVVDPLQNMRFIQIAPYRINGINYPGSSSLRAPVFLGPSGALGESYATLCRAGVD